MQDGVTKAIPLPRSTSTGPPSPGPPSPALSQWVHRDLPRARLRQRLYPRYGGRAGPSYGLLGQRISRAMMGHFCIAQEGTLQRCANIDRRGLVRFRTCAQPIASASSSPQELPMTDHTAIQPDASSALARLMTVMARLRDPERGCEWDTAQTFATIAPYTIEEAYEVADAIARGDLNDLKDELGDLALQIVFHAQMAAEVGHFTLAEVLDGISDKMERRHPHIFGDDPTGGHHRWEEIKAAERAARADDPSVLAGVALALPALERAVKLQKRAARTGFDWPDIEGSRGKIFEEMEEVAAATTDAEREEEVGDLLFAVVNFARFLKINPEQALRSANAKFERRFRAIETAPGFATMTLDEQEQLWVAQKSR